MTSRRRGSLLRHRPRPSSGTGSARGSDARAARHADRQVARDRRTTTEVATCRRAGAPRRIELEAPATIASTRRLAGEPGPGADRRAARRRRLRTLFTIRQRRHERDSADGDGAAQLSLDRCEVVVGARPGGHLRGARGRVADGRRGTPRPPRRPCSQRPSLVTPERAPRRSIARQLMDREQAATARRRPLPVPKTPGVRADDPLAEAGRKVLRMHLARMLAARPGTRSGEDIEDLHKMRVATRRMRAVWRVFDGAYRPKVQRRYVRELREVVATALGTVRDLDVPARGPRRLHRGTAGAMAAAMEPLRAGAGDAQREARAARPARAARLPRLPGLRRRLPGLRRDARRGRASPATRLPVLVRDTAGGTDLDGLRAPPRARDRAAAGRTCRRSTRCASTPSGCATRWSRSGEVLPPRGSTRSSRSVVTGCRTTSGMLNDADVPPHLARAWLTARGPRRPSPAPAAVRTSSRARRRCPGCGAVPAALAARRSLVSVATWRSRSARPSKRRAEPGGTPGSRPLRAQPAAEAAPAEGKRATEQRPAPAVRRTRRGESPAASAGGEGVAT